MFRARIWPGYFTALPSPQLAAQQAYSFPQLHLAPEKLNNLATPEKKRKKTTTKQASSTQENAYKGKS